MALSRYVEKIFGVKTRMVVNPLSKVVNSAATKVLGNNPDRFSWAIVNLSDETMYLAWSQDVSSSKGVLLTANGGSTSLTANEDLELVGYPVWMIATSDAKEIYAVEVEAE